MGNGRSCAITYLWWILAKCVKATLQRLLASHIPNISQKPNKIPLVHTRTPPTWDKNERWNRKMREIKRPPSSHTSTSNSRTKMTKIGSKHSTCLQLQHQISFTGTSKPQFGPGPDPYHHPPKVNHLRWVWTIAGGYALDPHLFGWSPSPIYPNKLAVANPIHSRPCTTGISIQM